MEQLGLSATITEPAHLEPVLCNKRGRDSERPTHRNEEWHPIATTREKALAQKRRPNTAINKKQNKTKNLETMNAGEGVEKREPSCTVGGNVN